MSRFAKLTAVEARLFTRDVGSLLTGVLLPTVLLAVLASIPALSEPSELFGGRFIDAWVPSLVVISLAILGLQALPASVATSRERGVLRRLSTTPVHPANLLAAQVVVQLTAALLAVVLLVVVGRVAFGVPWPRHALGFTAALVAGAAALFALGLVVAAVASTARAAGLVGTLVFLPVMFFGGVYFPRELMPAPLARVAEYLPPGVQALQDAWTGTGPRPAHLLTMAVAAAAAGFVAARLFRWE